jgi:hypothetical protein
MPGTSTAQALSGRYARAQAGPAAVIVPAVISWITSNQGDISWSLARSNSPAYPQRKPALEGTGDYRRKVISINGPRIPLPMAKTCYLDIELEFKYNGASIRDVVPRVVDMDDILGEGLKVESQLIEEDELRPVHGPNIPIKKYAIVRYVLTYHFDHVIGDTLAHTEVWITGEGEHWEQRDWPSVYVAPEP